MARMELLLGVQDRALFGAQGRRMMDRYPEYGM
jgi:hypothetical protein